MQRTVPGIRDSIGRTLRIRPRPMTDCGSRCRHDHHESLSGKMIKIISHYWMLLLNTSSYGVLRLNSHARRSERICLEPCTNLIEKSPMSMDEFQLPLDCPGITLEF